MRKLTILMLVTRRQRRGAEISAANLSAQLIQRGHRVLWVGLYAPVSDYLEVKGAIQEDLPGCETIFLSLHKIKVLRSLIRKYSVDILQANGSDNLRYAVTALIGFSRAPVLVYRNISKVSYWMGDNRLKKIFYQWLVSRVQFVIAVGEESMRNFIATYHLAPSKITVIRRGIPISSSNRDLCRSEISLAHRIDLDKRILVWAGALSHEKNPFLALQIMQGLSETDYQLLMAGNGPLEKLIIQQKEAKKLNHVHILGYQNDLQHFLAASDLLLLTSKVEGVPGVILEAAACGTPAIAVNVGGVCEALVDGETGFLVPADAGPEDFVRLISNISEVPVLRETMGENGRKRVESEFSEAKAAERFIEVYYKLLNKKN